jgi:hypothetical protein
MLSASVSLIELGRTVLAPYAALPGVACAAITGSSAEGLSDYYSDLDMTVYYDAMPPEDQVRAVRERLGGSPLIWSMGKHEEGEFAEAFRMRGVECQIGHTTVAKWETDMTRILAGEEPGSPLHKAMSGTLVSIPLSGADRLDAWKERLRNYPDALRLATVRHYLKFFPIWGVLDRVLTRDATLWFNQTMVESSFNLIGVAAGLSRKYFTPFQFKRAKVFIATLSVAPPDLYGQLESLWRLEPAAAAAALKPLVAQTADLVERHLPEVEIAGVRKALARDDRAWIPPA